MERRGADGEAVAGPQPGAAVPGRGPIEGDGPATAGAPGLVAGPQPAAAVDVPVGAVAGPVLDDERRALLAAVLDRIVPPNGDVPGAGALGVGDAIERTLAGSAPLRRLILDGLVEVDVAAGPAGFAVFDTAARDELLRAVEAAHPAFFAALVNHAYRGYYTHPTVLQDLERATGYPARPPQPLGHAIEPWDEGLLARQRQRAPFWRRADGS
jgi:hypothetical protein